MGLTNIIKRIYIIHYNKLFDRKHYLENYFKNNYIANFEFRNFYQRENLTEEIKNIYFKLNNLNPGQICITIEHIETYKDIVKNDSNNSEWYLILEDDAIFKDNFIENINKYLENVPDDAEYLDICDYFEIESNNLWERKNFTRTNCSYLIKKSTCEKLLTTIVPFEKAIDHELNKQFLIHDIKAYWSNKSLTHHGSTTIYPTSYKQF
jgi:GR25 family glycosyltransferase involved in LPS biosynthesis